MIHKATHTYANHGVPLKCDVYTGDAFPQDAPVFLYFHPGGLVAWNRGTVPPWLVQLCYQRRWPLVSASYRFLPQVGAEGMLEDAKAAFAFAQQLETASSGVKRKVIAGGGSAGFFMASLIAYHETDTPIALFSRSGIPSFHHRFFNSSTQLTPEPIPDADVAMHLTGPAFYEEPEPCGALAFDVNMLNSDGTKNTDYTAPTPASVVKTEKIGTSQDGSGIELQPVDRGMLYDYYLYNNSFLELVGSIDPGSSWGRDIATAPDSAKLRRWPPSIILHGDDDFDFPLDGNVWMRDALGEDKVLILVAPGQGHLFERGYFLEHEEPGMEQLRQAIQALDSIVASS